MTERRTSYFKKKIKKCITKSNYKQFCANKFVNLQEMETFLERNQLLIKIHGGRQQSCINKLSQSQNP